MNWDTKISKQRLPRNGTSRSCFDVQGTRRSVKRAGDLMPNKEGQESPNSSSFTCHKSTLKKNPKDFTRKGSGFGGTLHKPEKAKAIPAFPDEDKDESQNAWEEKKRRAVRGRRLNPKNTSLRLYYERGDIPCALDHNAIKNEVVWKEELESLNYEHWLGIFAAGLREKEEPYATLAELGFKDMIEYDAKHEKGQVYNSISRALIIPIKEALNTRDPAVILKVLKALQFIVQCDVGCAGALLNYSHDLLPVLNSFTGKVQNLGDKIDYGRNPTRNLGEVIMSTLELLELHGGEGAFNKIKGVVPIYQSILRR